MFGKWESNVGVLDRAGGCLNKPDTFLNNPQFRYFVVTGRKLVLVRRVVIHETLHRFDITKEEDDVIFQMSQEDLPGDSRKELLIIGFHIMRVESNRKYRVHKLQHAQVTSDYVKTKHVFLRASLSKASDYGKLKYL